MGIMTSFHYQGRCYGSVVRVLCTFLKLDHSHPSRISFTSSLEAQLYHTKDPLIQPVNRLSFVKTQLRSCLSRPFVELKYLINSLKMLNQWHVEGRLGGSVS